jgi:hypothetical protein
MFTGRVYKIVHHHSDIVYVGSTKNELRHRWAQHKCMFKKWMEDKTAVRGCALFKYLEQFGTDSFSIIPIKEYEVCDKLHLQAWEQLWINKLRCVNEKSPNPLMTKKQRDRMDYLKHREERIAKVRAYAAANKEKIAEKGRAYREKNKEELAEKKRETTMCECGSRITKLHMKRHLATAKHCRASA